MKKRIFAKNQKKIQKFIAVSKKHTTFAFGNLKQAVSGKGITAAHSLKQAVSGKGKADAATAKPAILPHNNKKLNCNENVQSNLQRI